jgi:hypothetical protein
VAIGAGVVIDNGVKIGKSSVIDTGYHFGADFYQFCRVGSLPHRFLSLSLVKPNVWRKLPHWVIWYGTGGTTPMIRIFLATEIFYIFATEHPFDYAQGKLRGHRDIRHEKTQKFLTLIYAD